MSIRGWWLRMKWKRKSNDIRAMFSKRATTFTEHTAKILVNMENAMTAIHDYMGFKTAFEQGAVLEWREVALLGTGEESMILLVGVLIYPPGATIQMLSGEKIEINQNTSEYFHRLVRVGLPLKYAQASKQEVFDYLKEADELNKQDLEEMKLALEELEKDEAVVPVKSTRKKKNDTISTGEDFDLSQLTEEQRKNLVLPIKQGRR